MTKAESNFPVGAENYTVDEFNFSEFPIIIVNLSGPLPERTLLRAAKDMQDRIEGMDGVLKAELAGHHLGRYQREPAHADGDLQPGEDVGHGARDDDVPEHLLALRPQAVGGAEVGFVD